MAVTIGATPDTAIIRLQYEDVHGEQVIKSFEIDGAAADVDIETAMTALNAIANPGVLKAALVPSRLMTGWSVASAASQNSVAMIMALTFQKTDPVNANKTVYKSFIVPGWLDGLKDVDSKPVTNSANLNALISFLEDNLNYVGADGTNYPGGWTYNRSRSGFGATSREIDALPG